MATSERPNIDICRSTQQSIVCRCSKKIYS